MRVILRVLAFITLAISGLWLYYERNFEPALTTVVSLSALISTFLFKKDKKISEGQHQKVGKNSNAVQAGGDINISLGNNSNKDV